MKFTIKPRENLFLSGIIGFVFTFFVVLQWPQLPIWGKIGAYVLITAILYLLTKFFGTTYWVDDEYIIVSPGRYEKKYAIKDIKKIKRAVVQRRRMSPNNMFYLIFDNERVEINKCASSSNGIFIENHIREKCRKKL